LLDICGYQTENYVFKRGYRNFTATYFGRWITIHFIKNFRRNCFLHVAWSGRSGNFKNNLPIKIFTLDTGRLFYEHYDLLSKNNSRYQKKTEVYFPESSDVEKYMMEKGVNAFYHSVENRKECCFIRKVKPLNRALENAKVWITGLRAEQSENRENMSVLEWDEERNLYKYNPLINWAYQDVLNYLEQNKVQELSLHKKGFISVGCQPCTRAIEDGENPRAGRWWWESSQKECGLHT
jgi:phosphoadenosine phosphosulfate reductase